MSRLLALLAFCLTAAWQQASAQEARAFALLKLEGYDVKWGEPAHGTAAVVTIAIAEGPMSFPNARNCGTVTDPAELLEGSHLHRADFERAVAAAAQAWQSVSGIRFEHVETADTANIVVGVDMAARGWAFANVIPGPYAEAGSRGIESAAICFNPHRPWKIGFDGRLDVYDLIFVMTHELGHAIGLDHPGRVGAVMGYVYDELHATLQPSDIAGAVALYGPPASNDSRVAAVALPRTPTDVGDPGSSAD